jgi:hypothetical protein
VLIYAIPVVLAVWALVDLWQTPRSLVRAMAKPFWFIAVLFLPVLGPLTWLLVGAQRRRRFPGGGAQGPAPRPVAPDDDPDFLRKLDEERRRKGRSASGDTTGDAPSD